ncbi:MAG: transketolase [Peptococcaceae bacterium]|nr:transketolase [Peptococcaceae bacterium]
MPLNNREKQLIKFIRELGWGEVKVRIENGTPVLIYEAIRTFKLEEYPQTSINQKKGTRL